MKGILKRTAATAAVIVMAVTGFTGCSNEIKDTDVAATVDGVEIPLNIANFHARLTQMYYESYMSSYYGDDMWTQKQNDETMEETTKGTLMDSLKQMYILDANKDKYEVALTEDDEKSIEEAAKQFMEDNGEEAVGVMAATEDVVKEYLRLVTVEQKVTEVIKEDTDREVSDDDAAQKAMKYVEVKNASSTGTDDAEEEKEELSDEELKAKAEEIKKAAKDEESFDKAVEEAGYTSSEATFDAATAEPSAEFIEAMDKLKGKEISDVIEGSSTYYVGILTSEFDKEATEKKKEDIITERENTLFDEVYKELEDEVKFTLNEKVWAKVEFAKTGVIYKQKESEEDADDGTDSGDNSELDGGEETDGAQDTDTSDKNDGEKADDGKDAGDKDGGKEDKNDE